MNTHNTTAPQITGLQNAFYLLNSDNKVELHLDGKQAYNSLPESVKTDIKRAFIWGRQRGAWVSRSKDCGVPYAMRGYSIPFNGEQERKSYEESREQKIERAENKAERYEGYAESRERKAESLQSEFNKLRKDWSWLTQPYVNTSGGRSFRNQKEKVMARYGKGFESYKIANQHRETAEALKRSASEAELKSESYLINRVKENEKNVRAFDKFQALYADKLENIDQQSDDWKIWLKARLNFYTTSFEKLAFFYTHLQELTIAKKEAGLISADDINENVQGNVKKKVKDYLKAKYNVDLLKFTKAYGVGVKTVYYIKTAQPLPLEYTSGWASDSSAQINLAKILTDIETFNTL
jgi:hypothetical protein